MLLCNESFDVPGDVCVVHAPSIRPSRVARVWPADRGRYVVVIVVGVHLRSAAR
jgi:hypothetical protein